MEIQLKIPTEFLYPLAFTASENPPKYIDSNTAGNKILKGFIEKDLINGQAAFEKIQIKEVTSHFRNGWVFFVVYPKISNNTNQQSGPSGTNVINPTKVKPLILEKVVVKAKKAKEKDANEGADEASIRDIESVAKNDRADDDDQKEEIFNSQDGGEAEEK
eukprot:CAMPEP_0114592856 /NCGR_PEP_ID=MMETSP0125-20121206/14580_1 /TAXON_ID=485358 ORGANISM="Aristerostoma sp., Strain ATCC 50986" /NCGR_SAMPLE_ID=MMETSP0125 /ASSEMBLY_ACC=CAM_ASM_000245 /LENGTH=160 /DNA_ID=CAMNT_0001791713 /DNA_START=1180 /DNA_END=1661 /DNA_ORIENTATION=+